MAAFSAIMRGMNILLSIAITTGILSGIWGWVAVSLGLLSWAGFLGCTAYFACPQGGLKGLAISAATLLSGVVWAMVIIYGSARWGSWITITVNQDVIFQTFLFPLKRDFEKTVVFALIQTEEALNRRQINQALLSTGDLAHDEF